MRDREGIELIAAAEVLETLRDSSRSSA